MHAGSVCVCLCVHTTNIEVAFLVFARTRRFADGNFEFLVFDGKTVECADGAVGRFRRLELHKAVTQTLAGFLVAHHFAVRDVTERAKHRTQTVVGIRRCAPTDTHTHTARATAP
jgi:hypothetical protein